MRLAFILTLHFRLQRLQCVNSSTFICIYQPKHIQRACLSQMGHFKVFLNLELVSATWGCANAFLIITPCDIEFSRSDIEEV